MERSLEQLAQTTEPQMVQRRFDEHNLVWAFLISWLFVVTSLILVPSAFAWKQQRLLHSVLAIGDALLTFFMVAAMGELRRARRREKKQIRAYARVVDRNLSGWLVTIFIVKVATLTYFALADNAGWIVWGVVFSILTIALRLRFTQRAVLNATILAIAV